MLQRGRPEDWHSAILKILLPTPNTKLGPGADRVLFYRHTRASPIDTKWRPTSRPLTDRVARFRLGPHRLILRPRESCEVCLKTFDLKILPQAQVSWAQAFVGGNPTDTLAMFNDLSTGVTGWIVYQSRDEEGTQSPVQSLKRGWGSCRDIAVLFVEAARSLGFGARITSGYLHNPDQGMGGTSGGGSTHAWAEGYVPGDGWIPFDPTNRSVGGANLVPVAVACEVGQSIPPVPMWAYPDWWMR